MIRITYRDTVCTWGEIDDSGRPLSIGPQENPAWVTVLEAEGFRMEFLDGGTREEPQ